MLGRRVMMGGRCILLAWMDGVILVFDWNKCIGGLMLLLMVVTGHYGMLLLLHMMLVENKMLLLLLLFKNKRRLLQNDRLLNHDWFNVVHCMNTCCCSCHHCFTDYRFCLAQQCFLLSRRLTHCLGRRGTVNCLACSTVLAILRFVVRVSIV